MPDLGAGLVRYRYELAAFLLPLFIRALPEVVVGPYPVGFDTIAFYVPNTLDWAAGKVGTLEILGTAPLMYLVSVPLFLLGADPVFLFKVMGPVLYGAMIWALFRFLQTCLGWNDAHSLGGGLLVAAYFAVLRIGWDMYRNMLGLTFILLSLVVLEGPRTRSRELLLSGLVVLAVASDQLTGVLILVVLGWEAFRYLRKRAWGQFYSLLKASTPGLVLFVAIVLAWSMTSDMSLVQQQSPVPGPENVWNSLGFLGFLYLPFSPLIYLGVKKTAHSHLRSWAVFSFGASLTALLPFIGVSVMSYRWSLLLAIPFGIWTAEGISLVRGVRVGAGRSVALLKRGLIPVFSMALALSAALYLGLPAESASPYYSVSRSFPNFDAAEHCPTFGYGKLETDSWLGRVYLELFNCSNHASSNVRMGEGVPARVCYNHKLRLR